MSLGPCDPYCYCLECDSEFGQMDVFVDHLTESHQSFDALISSTVSHDDDDGCSCTVCGRAFSHADMVVDHLSEEHRIFDHAVTPTVAVGEAQSIDS